LPFTDVAMFRPSTAEWWVLRPDGKITYFPWGAPASTGLGDIPVPADYDGDGRADFAVYRSTTGEWFIWRSSDNSFMYVIWGIPGDRPVPGDYDADGKADIAVYRPAAGVWYIRRSSDLVLMSVPWGIPSSDDMPVQAPF
jgi:FG-GAP-like repeat